MESWMAGSRPAMVKTFKALNLSRSLRGLTTPPHQFRLFMAEEEFGAFGGELELGFHDGVGTGAHLLDHVFIVAAQVIAEFLGGILLLGGEGAGGGEMLAARH